MEVLVGTFSPLEAPHEYRLYIIDYVPVSGRLRGKSAVVARVISLRT